MAFCEKKCDNYQCENYILWNTQEKWNSVILENGIRYFRKQKILEPGDYTVLHVEQGTILKIKVQNVQC